MKSGPLTCVFVVQWAGLGLITDQPCDDLDKSLRHLKNGDSGFCLALSWDRRIPRKSVDHCALYVVIWYPVFKQCEHHCKVIKTHSGRLKGTLVATSHGSDYLQVHWRLGDLSVESPPSSSAQTTHPPLLDLPHTWVVSRVAWDTPTKISTTSFSELL